MSVDTYIEAYASLLIVKKNTFIGNVLMCSASQTALSTVSDPLLESANLRKLRKLSLTHKRYDQDKEIVRS